MKNALDTDAAFEYNMVTAFPNMKTDEKQR